MPAPPAALLSVRVQLYKFQRGGSGVSNPPTPQIMLLPLPAKPLVPQLAREYGMDFYETSACSNLNIKESFTRLTELVLQAHRKELDELRGLPRTPTLARLEEDEQQPLGSEDTPKTCWC